MSKKKIKLDNFYYHEAIDRTYICADIIDRHLLKHPVIKKHKKLKKRIKKAQELLLETYQIIGGLEFKLFPPKQIINTK